MTILGFNLGRVGRSPAGKRVEAAGRAYQARVAAEEASNAKRKPLSVIPEVWAMWLPLMTMPIWRPTCRQLIDEVALESGFTYAEIIGQRRAPTTLMRARHEAYYRCAVETDQSYPRIGQAFGNRDHSTILHGIKVHCERSGAVAPNKMTWLPEGMGTQQPRKNWRQSGRRLEGAR